MNHAIDILRLRLDGVLDADGLRYDEASRIAYSYDNSRRSVLPDAVVLPTTIEQIAAVVAYCGELRVPVIARGRGTNTTGASVPVAGGIVVSCERMDRIIDVDPDDRVAVVEAGVLNGDLQAAGRWQPRLQCRWTACGEVRRESRQHAGAVLRRWSRRHPSPRFAHHQRRYRLRLDAPCRRL